MQSFVIESLVAGTVLEAWPLVHVAIPGLDLASWRRNAGAKIGNSRGKPRTGILLARRRVGRQICGMVWYRCETDLALGRILRARNLLAVDILDTAPILAALLNRLGPVARALKCVTIHLAAQDDGRQLLAPAHAVAALQLHTRLEKWLDISFSTELLCRTEAESRNQSYK